MSAPACAVEGCSQAARARGWCRKHYYRWYRTGDPGPVGSVSRPKKQRSQFDLWDRVLVGDGCWEIQGSRARNGYGTVPWPGTKSGMELGHRLAYMLWNGLTEIPEGLQVNHHCDNRPCCRPDHLYPGTHKDNTRDAIERGRLRPSNRGKAACCHGHLFDEENTYVYYVDGTPHRACRTCKAERARKAVAA